MTRRAFIAPVSEPLNGAWHDLSDFADIEELTAAALAKIERTPANNYAEELDSPDYEGFGNLFRGNYYTGIGELWEAHEWLEACELEAIEPEIALAYRDNIGGTGYPDADEIRDLYCGTWDTFKAYVEDLLDSTGELRRIPEDLRRHFDFESYAEELSDDYMTIRVSDGVAIFHNR